TVVSFRTPTVWEEHRALVMAAALVFVLQTGLVGALLIHRRRRRSAELQLKDSEERLLSTAASANVGLWQLDQDTGEFWMTEHCRRLFCLSGDAPLTLDSLMKTIHPDDRESAMSALHATTSPDQHAGDIRILAPGGETRWIGIRTRLHADERRSSKQLHGVFADITERKLAETEAALRRKEVAHLNRLMTMNAMSASIAHEISQPIGAMLASADAALLWLAKTPPELGNLRASIERIAKDGRRAGEVIASVRSVFRRDGAVTELIDVNGLIREILAIEREELQRHRIVVRTELATVARVSLERVQLQQVVLNLVTNAMDAMSSVTDGPRVLGVKTGVHATGYVTISVEDSGIGIDRDTLDRVFEPFFTTKSRGMGLGLWLCRRI